MLHAFMSLLSVVAEEKSKTPFYIAGCVFGAWAVALFVLGSRSETFPATPTAARALGGVSVTLALICGALIIYVG